jgi:hypothetical protein
MNMKPLSDEVSGTDVAGSGPGSAWQRMYGFAKVPSRWIQEGKLQEFKLPDGVPMLKTFIALAIAKGRFQRRPIGRDLEFFPATVTDLTDIACVHRTEVVRSLGLLQALGLIERLTVDPVPLGQHRRTAIYGFSGGVRPFLPLPFIHWERAEFLQGLRLRSAINLAALKVFLLLAAFRDNRSRCAMMSYDKIGEYAGIKRVDIPRALNMLVTGGLLYTRQPDPDNQIFATRYFLRGLDTAPHLNKGDAGTPLKELPSPGLYSSKSGSRR